MLQTSPKQKIFKLPISNNEYIVECSKNLSSDFMPKNTGGRPKGPDINKIALILRVLKQYPDGLWLRNIAKVTKLPPSTLAYYVNRYFNVFIDSLGFSNPETDKFIGLRIIRLKEAKKNVSVEEVMKYYDLRRSLANKGPL